MRYRCFFISVAGRIDKALQIEAAADEDALSRAREELKRGASFIVAVEVWDADRPRLIGRIRR